MSWRLAPHRDRRLQLEGADAGPSADGSTRGSVPPRAKASSEPRGRHRGGRRSPTRPQATAAEGAGADHRGRSSARTAAPPPVNDGESTCRRNDPGDDPVTSIPEVESVWDYPRCLLYTSP